VTKADRVWGVVILVFGGIYLLEGIRIPPAAIGDPLGPRTFPTILGIVMAACGAYLIARPEARMGPPALQRQFFRPVLTLSILLIAYALSIAWMGYLLATFLFLLASACIMGERSPIRAMVIALLFSVGMHLLFTRFLNIPLPIGLLTHLGLS